MTSIANARRSEAASSPRDLSVLSATIQYVFTAARRDLAMLLPVNGGMQNIAMQPRALLALLVYHYAIGILSSREIESALLRDVRFRSLCNDAVPEWRQLRRFRRMNREAVRRCLVQVLAEKRAVPALERQGRLAVGKPSLSIEDEADRRIQMAILLDTAFADE